MKLKTVKLNDKINTKLYKHICRSRIRSSEAIRGKW